MKALISKPRESSCDPPADTRFSALGRRRKRLVRKYVRPLVSNGTPTRLLNVLQGELHLRRRDEVLRSLPYVVAFDSTNVCNLRCPLCPTGQNLLARDHGRIEFSLYASIVDQIAKHSYKVILHNWGEPLLHPNIAEMVAYADDLRLATEISSNLNLLPDALAEDLVKAHLSRLVVSMDGVTQETYETYRKGGHVERVLENIARISATKERLGSRLPFIEVQVLVMRHNEAELDELERRVRESGADHCELGFAIVNSLDKEQMEQWLPRSGKFARYDRKSGLDRFNMSGRACSWLWRSLVVNWDGTVYPCCNFERREAEIGDLVSMGLRDLWNSPMYREARRVFKTAAGGLPQGPLRQGQHICRWCKGVPRAQSAEQKGVY